jgi:hypothetical protein
VPELRANPKQSRSSREVVPAQPVDATLSNSADPQMFTLKNSICLTDVAKPSQGKVPADLIVASAFSFCFQ